MGEEATCEDEIGEKLLTVKTEDLCYEQPSINSIILLQINYGGV